MVEKHDTEHEVEGGAPKHSHVEGLSSSSHGGVIPQTRLLKQVVNSWMTCHLSKWPLHRNLDDMVMALAALHCQLVGMHTQCRGTRHGA
jgi:hypothetical protein